MSLRALFLARGLQTNEPSQRLAHCLSAPWLRFASKRLHSRTVDDFQEKYGAKLEAKARREGFGSVREMLQAYKAKDDATKLANMPPRTSPPSAPENAALQRLESTTQPMTMGSASKPTSTNSNFLNNDSHVIKPLDQIIRLDKVANETAETIGKIWTDYHADKDVLTAVIPADSYHQLYRRSKLYPRFVFPVPHGEGMEVYYAQFHFHQCFFTPLLEFKTHGESAKPYLTLTHYTDLQADKGIVLMRGERADPKVPLSMPNAQYLALALQQFYLIGSATKQKLVEDFNVRPREFDFEQVVAEANKLD